MTTSRKIALLFAAENINAIFGWFALLFVARKMGASVLGEVSYALSIVGSFTFLAILGFRMAHIKRVSEGMDLGKCIATFLSIRLVLISFMVVIFVFCLWIWTNLLGKQLYDIQTPYLIATILVYYVLLLLSEVFTSTFSGLKQGARVAISKMVMTSVRSILFIAAAFMGLGAIWLARSYAISVIFVIFVSLWYFRDLPISKPDIKTFNSYKIYAFPVAAASIFLVFRQFVDKIIIGIFWSVSEVGLYFGVQRITLFIATMAIAVEEMLFPTISKHHSASEQSEIFSLVHKTEKYVGMVCIPIVAMTMVFSSEIILVFISREFLPAFKILQWLALVALVQVTNRPWSIALRGSNRPDLVSMVSIFSSIFCILLMLYLVPSEIPHLGLDNLPGMGGEGAAIGILVSEILGGITLRILCYKFFGIAPRTVFFVQLFVAFLVGYLMWQVNVLLVIDRWYELFSFSIMGGLLFIFVLASLGSFTNKDFLFFWRLLNPNAMKMYIQDEMTRKQ